MVYKFKGIENIYEDTLFWAVGYGRAIIITRTIQLRSVKRSQSRSAHIATIDICYDNYVPEALSPVSQAVCLLSISRN